MLRMWSEAVAAARMAEADANSWGCPLAGPWSTDTAGAGALVCLSSPGCCFPLLWVPWGPSPSAAPRTPAERPGGVVELHCFAGAAAGTGVLLEQGGGGESGGGRWGWGWAWGGGEEGAAQDRLLSHEGTFLGGGGTEGWPPGARWGPRLSLHLRR